MTCATANPDCRAPDGRSSRHLARNVSQVHDPMSPVAPGHSGDSPSADQATAATTVAADDDLAAELPALELRDGLPALTTTASELRLAAAKLAAGSGPVAVDTERAGGFRYTGRAYLLQFRRAGSGTVLLDPLAAGELDILAEALSDAEWILHAASQDLPCLALARLLPHRLFDTELAGRLLGMPRVGLAGMVADVLGRHLPKGLGAADWSTRPLPEPWLRYAALDVEVLIELREHLAAELAAAGKAEWAAQEFAALVAGADAPAVPRSDPWRRAAGPRTARGRRGLAIARELWTARDRLAAASDTAPGRLLPDSAIAVAAAAAPRSGGELLGLAGFSGRGVARHRRVWMDAVTQAWALPEEALPPLTNRDAAPPPARAWSKRDPQAAHRLAQARADLGDLAHAHNLPVENLVAPDIVRRVLWDPPAADADLPALLKAAGARPWQVDLVSPVLRRALDAT